VYEITLRKLIDKASVANLKVAKTGTKANIQVEQPAQVQLSAKPLTGKYRIKCIDPEGYTSWSQDLKWNQWHSTVAIHIGRGCEGLFDRVEVREGYKYHYRENGRSFYVRFVGLKGDPGQLEIVEVENTEETLQGQNLKYTATTIVPYSTNLFYEPIPFEMLQTYETKP